MAALDWIFMALLLASMLIGAWRGLVFEVLSVLGWLAAFVVAQWFAADVAAYLPLGDLQGAARYAAGFVVTFVLALFGCGFIAWLGKKLVEHFAQLRFGARIGQVSDGLSLKHRIDRRDGADLKLRGDELLLVHVDLGQDHALVGVFAAHLFQDRG